MNAGKMVFSQLMEFLPAHEFNRCVERHGGHYKMQSLTCRRQFLAMAFAQLTYRESLRDIEACLRAVPQKLYHMGIGGPVARTTLADANEKRDWRIYQDFAQVLIREARSLYAGESLCVELDQTVYALDSTTIDLCLTLFPWAKFRKRKGAVKVHTQLDLRGNIPSFIVNPRRAPSRLGWGAAAMLGPCREVRGWRGARRSERGAAWRRCWAGCGRPSGRGGFVKGSGRD